MAPLGVLCTQLLQQTENPAVFRSDRAKHALIGLFRDLRGIAMAANSRRTYGLLFDWLYPTRFPLLLRSMVRRCRLTSG